MIAQYIATRLILDLCEVAERRRGCTFGEVVVGIGGTCPGGGKEDNDGDGGGVQGGSGEIKEGG